MMGQCLGLSIGSRRKSILISERHIADLIRALVNIAKPGSTSLTTVAMKRSGNILQNP
jgi:hypothetical protein